MIKSKHFFPLAAILGLLSGCGDRYETILPPGAVASKSTTAKAVMPEINIDKTRMLFGLATNIEVGDKVGLFELRKEGMLVHPGETKATKVSFNLDHRYQEIIILPFIAALPADATAVKEAGTVSVEFILDGKSEGKLMINRDSTDIKTLDLTNVELLTVVVDNGDGKPWFDWLMLGVVDLK